MKAPETASAATPERQEDGPLSRWARRKREVQREVQRENDGAAEAAPGADMQAPGEADLPADQDLLTDDDMPPIESLNADSDFSGFMSSKVSEPLRRRALRKLFGSAQFNIRDGLDDYDGDYTSFAGLGGIITADLRHQLEVELQKKIEAAAQHIESGAVESDTEIPVEDADMAASDAASNPASDPEADLDGEVAG